MHIVESEFKSFLESYTESKDFFVAYSGGVDSQVLLYLSNKYIKASVSALHVNHGISSNAKKWADFCYDSATKYNIKIKTAVFNLKDEKSNLEEKARDLRYDFFEENVKEGALLMTGHHLDDQAETFMLRLMRGAGVDGLSAMKQERPFGRGKLIRPLLTVSKEEIIDFAKSVNLKWVEDESNKDTHYDRNFIRNEVMPLLKTRWANANKSIARSASHCEKASLSVDDIAKEKLKYCKISDNILCNKKLIKLSIDEKRLVLREWIKEKNFKMPDEKALNVLIADLVFSSNDSNAVFETKNYKMKKSFEEIHFLKEEQNIVFSFVEVKEDVKEEEVNSETRMLYNGQFKKVKAILKEEKIPRWERNLYKVFLIGKTVISIGNIKSDEYKHIEIKKEYI